MTARLVVFLCALCAVMPTVALTGNVSGVDVRQLERELNCPTCKAPLTVSNSPAADRIRARLRTLVAEGKSEDQIKAELVREFGRPVLASPPKEGFDLVAWIVPSLAVLLGLAAIPLITRRWAARAGGSVTSVPELDASPDELARLEDELRARRE